MMRFIVLIGLLGLQAQNLDRLRSGLISGGERRAFFASDLLRSTDPQAEGMVRGVLVDPTLPEEAQEALLRGIAHRKDGRFLKELLPYLADGRRPKAAAAALEALKSLRDEPSVVSTLLFFLGSEEVGTDTRLAARALGELADVRAVPDLIRLLARAPDDETRAVLARSLEKITRVDSLGADPVRWREWKDRIRWRDGMTREELLEASLLDVRNDAVQAQKDLLREKKTDEVMLKMLRSHHAEVRELAAQLLGQKTVVGDLARTLRALIEALADPWEAVVAEAARSLGWMAELVRREVPEPGPIANEAMRQAEVHLETLLDRPSERLRVAALVGLTGIRSAKVQERLRDRLLRLFQKGEDPTLRALLAKALGEMKDGSAVPVLSRVLREDPHGPARVEAATALGRLPVASVTDALIAAFRAEKEIAVKVRVAFALAGREDPAAVVPVLLEGLMSEDVGIRQVCVTGLGRLGDQRAGEPLRELLLSRPEEGLVTACLEALGKLRYLPAREALVEYLGQKAHAEKASKAMRELAGTDAERVLAVGPALVDAGRAADAADLYRGALAGAEGERQQQLRLAFLKALARVEGEGALAEMEEVADGLIREDPGREAFVRRIEVGAFLRERAWRKAEMHLRALADGAPDDRVVAVGLAECAQGQGRLPEAAERYRRVLEGMAVDGPERWELGVRLAEVLATEGRVEGRREAEEVLRGLPARFEELAPEGLRARRVAVERTLGVRREGAGSR